MPTKEASDARQARRKEVLVKIQNLEIAKQCLEQNLALLRRELTDLHQAPLELGRRHSRSHTGTGRYRRLEASNEGDDPGGGGGEDEPSPPPNSVPKVSIFWWHLIPLLTLIP